MDVERNFLSVARNASDPRPGLQLLLLGMSRHQLLLLLLFKPPPPLLVSYGAAVAPDVLQNREPMRRSEVPCQV